MNWQKLLNARKVKLHVTSVAEISGLRAVVARDILDAQVTGLSTDRQFACLYGAALQLTQMVIACSGYRVATVSGHHRTSFEALELAMGAGISTYGIYFDACRRKRNLVEYDTTSVATESEVAELLSKVKEFEDMVELWIENSHPPLARIPPQKP